MPKTISKKRLEYLYGSQRLSTWSIEKKFKYSRSFIYKKLIEYKIPTRSISGSHLKTARTKFSGNPIEKAYIFGFTVGDLRIRFHNKGNECKTISIACSSSKPSQIKLIESIFSRYGHIWKGEPNKKRIVSIEAFVDLSFSFLLGKNWKKFKKEMLGKDTFLAFLAGFIDAEGSIFISRNMAFFSVGNYDKDILFYIKRRLAKIGIETRAITCDNLKGYKGRDGYVRSADYYNLSCSKKTDLNNLLISVRKFCRHEDKKRAIKIALDNISKRNQKFS